MSTPDLVLRLGAALLGGALIGAERQWYQHRAGLRTNVLVALGAALFVALGAMTPGESSPTRIASYVVSGVGFLGAGAILRDGFDVRGLNTAATLWCAAAVGSLAGFGYFSAAALGALAIVGTNVALRPLARRLTRRTPTVEAPVPYTVTVRCRRARETSIRALLVHEIEPTALVLHALHSVATATPGVVEIHAHVLATAPSDSVLEQIVARLSHERDVSEVSWSIGWDNELTGDTQTLPALSEPVAQVPAIDEQPRARRPLSAIQFAQRLRIPWTRLLFARQRSRDRGAARDGTSSEPPSRLTRSIRLAMTIA